MQLSAYLKDRNLTASTLATAVGCRVSTITRIRDRERRPSLKMAFAIESATGGAVTAAELCAAGEDICRTGKTPSDVCVTATEPAA